MLQSALFISQRAQEPNNGTGYRRRRPQRQPSIRFTITFLYQHPKRYYRLVYFYLYTTMPARRPSERVDGDLKAIDPAIERVTNVTSLLSRFEDLINLEHDR